MAFEKEIKRMRGLDKFGLTTKESTPDTDAEEDDAEGGEETSTGTGNKRSSDMPGSPSKRTRTSRAAKENK